MTETLMKDKLLMCNPDVVLREEDEDGGLLFNPDTNQVKVVNTTGLFIWKKFLTVNNPEKVTSAVLKNFEEAVVADVQTDLDEFLNEMIQTGFIGIVQP